MGKKLLLFLPLSLFLFISPSFSQCEKWDTTVSIGYELDDYHMDSEVDLQGNLFIAGYFYSDSLTIGDTTIYRTSTYEGFLAKLDTGGKCLWLIQGATAIIYDIEIDVLGNVYFTGYSNSNSLWGMGNNWPWRNYLFIAKYGPNGNKIYTRQAGGGNGATAISYSIAVNGSGEVVISGYYTTAGLGLPGWGTLNSPVSNEGFICKWNSAGTSVLWAFGIYSPSAANVRGVDFDLSGNVYAVGYADGATMTLNGQVNSIQGAFDAYAIKFNNSGLHQWTTMFSGAGNVYLQQIEVNNFGKAFFQGSFQSDTISIGTTDILNTEGGGAATSDMILGEISSSGNLVWTSDFNSPGNNTCTGITPYGNTGIYFAGHFDGPILTNGQDTLTNSNPGFYDFYGGLLDFNGNLIWSRSAGGLANDYGRTINALLNGDLILSYRTNSPTYTIGNQTLTNAGSRDFGYSKLKNVPIQLNTTITQVTCGIGNDGAIDVQFSGGQSPYSVLWSHGPTSAQLTNLVPGNYEVTVSDANGCSTTKLYTIIEDISLNPQVTVFSADTCGANNGMAIASVTGGAPPYNFLWSTGSTSQVVSGLASGQYTLTVTDANSCQVIRVIDIGGSSPPQVGSSSSPTSTCGSSDGFAIVNISGQNPPFGILWSTGDTTSIAQNLPKGWYSVLVADSTGCQAGDSIFVDGPDQALVSSVIAHASCNGATDGSIDLSVSSGVPPYSFTWAHGPATEDLDSLAPGIYSVSIIDSDFSNNSCVTYDTFTILDPAPLGVGIDSVQPNCTQSNGSITATGQGGIPPYRFLWSTGDTISTLFNVPSGPYWVRIRDTKQCEYFRVVNLEDNVTFTTNLTTFNSDSCAQNTGVASVSMVGGQFPFSISWSNGATGAFVNQLPAGNYTVTITDAVGCSDTINFNIAGYNKPFLNLSKSDPQNCGGQDGAAVLQISGQAGPYNILWSSGDTTQVVFNLASGWYNVNVTDTNGCSSIDSIELKDPPKPRFNLSSQNLSCYGLNDGSVNLTILAGIPPFSFAWSNGSRTANQVNLGFGMHYINVYDSVSIVTGCFGVDSVMINQPPEILINSTTTDANCGLYTGSASIVVNGGIPPYDYRWTNGDQTLTADSLMAGIYLIEVEDATGCKVERQVLVSDVEAPTISANAITPISCFGGANGAIDISVTGGTTPYNFWWTNGSISEDISNLSVGPYEVMVIDDDSCISLATFQITQADELQLTSSSAKTDCGLSNGSAQVFVSGGIGPYSYSWASGGTGSNETGLGSGFYSATVTDQGGCLDTIWVSISEIGGPDVVIDSVNLPSCNQASGSIFITASGTGTPFNYTWSNGLQVEDLISVTPGLYSLTVSNNSACLGTATFDLGANQNFGDNICLVTVDSFTGGNLIVWEKNYFAGIDHYNVYRESSAAGVYQQIGSVLFSEDGEFIDTVAIPLIRSWRYKISSVDTCGNESNLSPEHKTIHLTQGAGLIPNSVNLSWDDYQGFPYSTFFLYRSTLANGWELIDSLPSTLNSYTNVIPNLINDPGLFYVVTVKPAIGCDTDKKGKTFNRSRSNNSTSGITGALMALSNSDRLQTINVFPNPFSEEIQFSQAVFNTDNPGIISIYNLQGSLLINVRFFSNEGAVSTSFLPPGIYFLEIKDQNSNRIIKIIKE
jgi:SprB repeat/Secretion system C-terminal sorting domain